MKPVFSVLLPVGILIAAATCGRLTATAAPSPTTPLREVDAIALYPGILRASYPVRLGVVPVESSERQALRTLKDCVTSQSKGGAPICVSWTDNMRRFPASHRAVYDPGRALLFYQTNESRPCVYIGVTQDGMSAALQSNTSALFATAHTFSYRSLLDLAHLDTRNQDTATTQ